MKFIAQILGRDQPKATGTLGHETSGAIIPNGIPPGFPMAQQANRSFRSVSSTSSVFMDDTKARLGALQMSTQSKRGENDCSRFSSPSCKMHICPLPQQKQIKKSAQML